MSLSTPKEVVGFRAHVKGGKNKGTSFFSGPDLYNSKHGDSCAVRRMREQLGFPKIPVHASFPVNLDLPIHLPAILTRRHKKHTS